MATIDDHVHLLPGERPDGFSSTAAMWLWVYGEMLRQMEELLESDQFPPTRSLLEKRSSQFRERMRFWEAELARLDLGERTEGSRPGPGRAPGVRRGSARR